MERSAPPPRVLLTGPPGCGKTTAIRRALEGLRRPAAGFVTEEVRAGEDEGPAGGTGKPRSRREGFDVVTLDGRRAPLARRGAAGPRVGRYGVDVASFEEVALPALQEGLGRPETLLVMDEIGKMEFLSRRFVALLDRIFEAPNPVVGTILAGRHPVADRLRARPGVLIREVTPSNRDRLPAELARMLD